ncbi:hypothetical protein H6758_00025 [Candidatus Nomurabacteria bacterium]|nr:hypothetical protein [Candidatus Nomurabacteria bacterium]
MGNELKRYLRVSGELGLSRNIDTIGIEAYADQPEKVQKGIDAFVRIVSLENDPRFTHGFDAWQLRELASLVKRNFLAGEQKLRDDEAQLVNLATIVLEDYFFSGKFLQSTQERGRYQQWTVFFVNILAKLLHQKREEDNLVGFNVEKYNEFVEDVVDFAQEYIERIPYREKPHFSVERQREFLHEEFTNSAMWIGSTQHTDPGGIHGLYALKNSIIAADMIQASSDRDVRATLLLTERADHARFRMGRDRLLDEGGFGMYSFMRHAAMAGEATLEVRREEYIPHFSANDIVFWGMAVDYLAERNKQDAGEKNPGSINQ